MGTNRGRLLTATLACLALLAWLSHEVLRDRTLAFDVSVRTLFHDASTPALTEVARVLSAVGSGTGLVVMTAAAATALLALRRRRAALLLGITMAGAFALDGTLKLVFHRPRPESFFGYPLPGSYGFPSGHALSNACFFGFLAALAGARVRSLPLRVTAWTLAAALVLAIGCSRVYLGVHYPSDVLAGYAAAGVWLGALACGYATAPRRRSRAG